MLEIMKAARKAGVEWKTIEEITRGVIGEAEKANENSSFNLGETMKNLGNVDKAVFATPGYQEILENANQGLSSNAFLWKMI